MPTYALGLFPGLGIFSLLFFALLKRMTRSFALNKKRATGSNSLLFSSQKEQLSLSLFTKRATGSILLCRSLKKEQIALFTFYFLVKKTKSEKSESLFCAFCTEQNPVKEGFVYITSTFNKLFSL
jgi:hypothetical protein